MSTLIQTSSPIPESLLKQWNQGVPLLIKTHTVAVLLVHWGFTDHLESGFAYVKKLVRSGTLKNVMKPGHDWRFETSAVLALWKEMQV